MSKLGKIWENKSKILEGLKNSVFKKEHIEELAAHRMSICEGCDKIDREGSSCVMPGTQPCCGECGCSLHLKLRSLSSGCDLDKWPAVMNEEQEDKLKDDLGYGD